MSRIASEFLSRCFAADETIAILLRPAGATGLVQRVVRVEQVLTRRYLALLEFENHQGANVYVSANPLMQGSRRRTKESIASVRHLYIDIDFHGDARIRALRGSKGVPTPSSILATSPGKYQVLWRVEGFDLALQEGTLRQLAHVFGGDPACTDCNRVLRIPGFMNRKYAPAHPVSVEYPSDSVWRPDDFRLENMSLVSGIPLSLSRSGLSLDKKTPSERDWAWVVGQLSMGQDAHRLTRQLAELRSDKPNPLYYAQRTVDMASAHQWVKDNVPTEDIVTMLVVRREGELPASLCSARAREITATAQRQNVRKKIA